MILGLVGEKLAGKDNVGAYLQKRYGAFFVKYSDIIDEVLAVLNLPVSRQNEIQLGQALRTQFQTNIFWGAIKKRISESQAPLKVIGSIRLPDEFEAAKALGAKLIYITAPLTLRYERYMQRREKADDGKQSFEEFALQEQVWTEKEIASLGQQADFKIENTGTLEELYGKVDEALQRLKQ